MSPFLHQLWWKVLLGIIWTGICGLFRVCRTSVWALLAFSISFEKSGVILIILILPLYVIWSFPLVVFSILSSFCIFSVLIIIYCGEFLLIQVIWCSVCSLYFDKLCLLWVAEIFFCLIVLWKYFLYFWQGFLLSYSYYL